MLHIPNLEEIEGLLLAIPELATRSEDGDPGFADEVKRWLSRAEQVLGNNRLPVTGSIGALRAVLVSSERGSIPAGLAFRGQLSRRRVVELTATQMMRTANELIVQAIEADQARIAEAERVALQLLALAYAKDLLPPPPHDGDKLGLLNMIWRRLLADPEAKPGTAHLLGLVGYYDALILLDRGLAVVVPPEPPP